MVNRRRGPFCALLAAAVLVAGCTPPSRPNADTWAALPHTMGCAFPADDTGPEPPGGGLVRQITLSHAGDSRLQLDVDFAFSVPPAPRTKTTRFGLIDAPGSIHTQFLIQPRHLATDALIVVSSPSPSVGKGWYADASEFDEAAPNILTEVSSAGRVLTLVLDFSAQPEILGEGEFSADVDVVQMVSGQPGSGGGPNLFPVRSPKCLWATPPASRTVERPRRPEGTQRGSEVIVTDPPALPGPSPTVGGDGAATFIQTKSGQVRCAVSAVSVVCERNSAEGFPQAPASAAGHGRWNLAGIASDGTFDWSEGNIGGGDPAADRVLEYGQSYRISGWTIDAGSEGTRFTNVDSGRGMFVSIENVSTF